MQIRSVVVVAALGLAASTPALAQQAVQWRVEDGGNGHWYQLVAAQGVSWSTALSQSQGLGGSLATLVTPAENGFVVTSFQGALARYPWIGLKQSPSGAEPASGWGWISGEPLSWTNWSPSEPNGDGVTFADEANLWLVAEPGRPLGTWNDWTTGGPNGFLVEWSADCNADGIVDYGQILNGTFDDLNANGVPDCCDAGESCTPCPGDVNDSGIVNGTDIAIILGAWGTSGGKFPSSDTDGNGIVDAVDLAVVLGGWGNCP